MHHEPLKRAIFDHTDECMDWINEHLIERINYMAATIQDQQAAIDKLNKAVSDLQARAGSQPPAVDPQPGINAMNAAATTIDTILPAPAVPPAA